jgi:Protein of unknown function (DUF4232)
MASPPATGPTRVAIAALAAIALGGCGSSGSATSTAAVSATTVTTVTHTATQSTTTTETSSSGPVACRAAGLALSFLGQQGATGHGELGFSLRNSSAAECVTIGYPGVLFLTRSGVPLPTRPTHTTDDLFGHSPLRSLIVGAGRTVSFRLAVTHGNGSSAGCTTAYGLQAIAPNDTATLRVSIPGGATECGTAMVSPLRPGTSAYP